MTVEAAAYISDLNDDYPEVGSSFQDLDNHIRLVKAVLQASLPSISGAVTATHTELNLLDGVTGTLRTTTPQAGEWVLMQSQTPSGSPTNIEFKNGTSGVTISSSYDEYLITFSDLLMSSASAALRLYFSTDTGATYPSGANAGAAQSAVIASGTQTVTSHNVTSLQYFPATGEQAGGGTPGADDGLSGQIRIYRTPSGRTQSAVMAEWTFMQGAKSGVCRGVVDTGASQFDAVKLQVSTSSFGNQGVVRFHGRKV